MRVDNGECPRKVQLEVRVEPCGVDGHGRGLVTLPIGFDMGQLIWTDGEGEQDDGEERVAS
jgi:hypothetical protein